MATLLIPGHGAGDTGAQGCGYQEYKLTRELVNLIAPKLRKYTAVDVYNQNRSAFYDCQNGSFKIGSYDYVLEVHFNACVNDQHGNGYTTGTEIYVTSSEKATTVEQAIVNKVAACGIKNRGVKVKDFLVIRTVKNMGISSALIETCFIDDKDDMDIYQSKKDAIADAIVNGIVEGFGLKAGEGQNKPETPSKPVQKPSTNTGKKEKYGKGIKVCTNTLATSSDGGKVYKGDWTGTITNIVSGAKYPYLLDNGNVGWTNDAGIDTDPHTPGASSTQAKPKPSTSKKEKYGTGIKVCTNTLATSSDGGKVYKGDWTGWIGRVIPGARYPYRVDDSKGNAIGWTDTNGIDTDPHIR